MSQAPTTSPYTLAIFAGGLGGNQFADRHGWELSLIDAAQRMPGVEVVQVEDPGDSDAVAEAIAEKRKQFPSIVRVIVACHSRGWFSAAKAASAGYPVACLIAVDPAWLFHRDQAWPTFNGKPVEGAFFKANSFLDGCSGIAQLNISGGPEIRYFAKEGHNGIVGNQEVRNFILLAIMPKAVDHA
jgi:hypothetical protein